MRGAPHNGFVVAISTINLRSCGSNGGRPARLRPEHRAQRRRSHSRCQRMTVSGCTRTRADRQRRQARTARPRTSDLACADEGASRAAGFGAAAAGRCSRAPDRGVRGTPPRSRARSAESVRPRRDCGVSGFAQSNAWTTDRILAKDNYQFTKNESRCASRPKIRRIRRRDSGQRKERQSGFRTTGSGVCAAGPQRHTEAGTDRKRVAPGDKWLSWVPPAAALGEKPSPADGSGKMRIYPDSPRSGVTSGCVGCSRIRRISHARLACLVDLDQPFSSRLREL